MSRGSRTGERSARPCRRRAAARSSEHAHRTSGRSVPFSLPCLRLSSLPPHPKLFVHIVMTTSPDQNDPKHPYPYLPRFPRVFSYTVWLDPACRTNFVVCGVQSNVSCSIDIIYLDVRLRSRTAICNASFGSASANRSFIVRCLCRRPLVAPQRACDPYCSCGVDGCAVVAMRSSTGLVHGTSRRCADKLSIVQARVCQRQLHPLHGGAWRS